MQFWEMTGESGSTKRMMLFSLLLGLFVSETVSLRFPSNNPAVTPTDDGLVRWGVGLLQASRTEVPAVGKELIVACHTESKWWKQCEFWSAGGVLVVDVDTGVVVDGNGDTVDGIEVWTDDKEGTCGIKVREMHDEGDWQCRLFSEFDENVFLGAVISTEVEVSTNLRLATHINPIHYSLSLVTDLFDTQDSMHFGGVMVMEVEVTAQEEFLMFHTEGLNIMEFNVTLLGLGEDEDTPVAMIGGLFDFQRTFFYVFGVSEFLAGRRYRIEVAYEARRENPNFADGLYKVPCSEDQDKYCWFTQFEDTSARKAFPCLDEPALKAVFDVRVARTDGWKTLANMPLVDTVPADDDDWVPAGWVWDIFSTSVAMSPYLVAFSISDYAGHSADSHNVTVWAPKPEIEAGNAEYAAKIGAEIIDFYEKHFDIEYALPKMDFVAANEFGGAMENWGLILFQPNALLIDPVDPDLRWKWIVTNIVAHELAHQWFGNLVTTAWWSQTWLNEGFATFVSYLGSDQVYPEGHAWGRMLLEETLYVMNIDSDMTRTSAMSDEVHTRPDILGKFGAITYSKGGSVIRMMESILTEPSFTKGLISYLKDNAFGSTVEEDLFFHLEAAGVQNGNWPVGQNCKDSFEETMKSWTDQAGLPLVTATRDWAVKDSVTVKLSQEMYVTVGEAVDRQWDIPISATTAGGDQDDWKTTTPSVWLTQSTGELVLEPLTDQLPLILNVQATGYFRVNYDENNWKLIAQTLNTNKDLIHPFNRAQIICDVISLASNNMVSMEIQDSVLSYIEQEDDYTPMTAYNDCHHGFKRESHFYKI